MYLRLNAVRYLRGAYLRLAYLYYARRFRWWDGSQLARLELAAANKLQVPLRSGGRGSLYIGRGNQFGCRVAVMAGDGGIMLQPRERASIIRVGDNNLFSNNVSVAACGEVDIGSGCQIGDNVAIYDSDFHEVNPATRNRSAGPSAPVRIGNNVWLGSRVMVLKGVTIGDHSVIGAMSLVTISIPPNCVAAGIPARVIRTIER